VGNDANADECCIRPGNGNDFQNNSYAFLEPYVLPATAFFAGSGEKGQVPGQTMEPGCILPASRAVYLSILF
jgi:hypothetical protein